MEKKRLGLLFFLEMHCLKLRMYVLSFKEVSGSRMAASDGPWRISVTLQRALRRRVLPCTAQWPHSLQRPQQSQSRSCSQGLFTCSLILIHALEFRTLLLIFSFSALGNWIGKRWWTILLLRFSLQKERRSLLSSILRI